MSSVLLNFENERQGFVSKYKIDLIEKILFDSTLGFVELLFVFPFSRCMFYIQILMGSGMLMLHLLFLHHNRGQKEGLKICGGK